jgi:hypothetical protein
MKLTLAYPLPGRFNASASFQSIPGRQITAAYTVTSAQVKDSLGRDLSSGPTSTARVQLVGPGELYGDRVNQLDVKLARKFDLMWGHVTPHVAVYNALNAGPFLGYNNTYGPNWQNPTSSLIGRMFKFGVLVDW